MKLRVVAVEPAGSDHNRTLVTLEVDAPPQEVKQRLLVPGETMDVSRRDNSLLGSIHVTPRHDDLPPGPKRVINTARSIVESASRDDTA